MSVINRMLRELDLRQAAAAERDSLPTDLRPAPAPPPRARWPWLMLALLLSGVAAAAWAVTRWPPNGISPRASATGMPASGVPARGAGRVAPSPTPVPAARQESADQPATQPAGSPPSEMDSSPVPADAGPAPVRWPGSGLRLSTDIATFDASPLPSHGTRSAAPARPRLFAAPDSPGVAAAPVSSAPATGAARVDKRWREPSARERAEGLHRRAISLLTDGRAAEAGQALEEALAADAAYTPARQALVALRAESGRVGDAQALLLEGLALNPAQPRMAVQLARLAAESGDHTLAWRALQAAAPAAGGDAEFHATYAAILARLGRHHEAAEAYLAALRVAPEAGVWWLGLGLSLEAEGRGDDAFAALRRAAGSGALSPELARFVDQKLRGRR